MTHPVKKFVFYQFIPSVILIYAGVKVLDYNPGYGHLFNDLPGLLFMMASIVLVAIINSGMIARWITKIILPLFYPSEHYHEPMPVYSIPRSKRKSGQYDEAMLEYEKIICEHPEEHQPYIEMMEIAMVDLHSPEKLDAIYERGMNAIKDEKQLDNLTRYFGVLQQWKSKPIA